MFNFIKNEYYNLFNYIYIYTRMINSCVTRRNYSNNQLSCGRRERKSLLRFRENDSAENVRERRRMLNLNEAFDELRLKVA